MRFENSYARLPERFYTRTPPSPVTAPRVLKFNEALAGELGLNVPVSDISRANIFSGNEIPPGAEPIALAYAGHQFGHFSPQLGDGRAVLLGEVVTRDGRRLDLQLKGSGRTPFSRGGDGRAAIGPVLREYLVSEAMHALGVPTTRALAAIATGETVMREGRVQGAVLTRLAASHLRVGTFQFFAARGDDEAVRLLVAYAISRHYPHLAGGDTPALSLLGAVMAAQAKLVAHWLGAGFIHGVMNTDNSSISGETIDYGPCAFVDAYDHMAVFSSIDMQGRYAFNNQPPIAQWNLARLAEAMLPLIDADRDKAIAAATQTISGFMPLFREAWTDIMRRKLGLLREEDEDAALASDLLNVMHETKLDFTLTFRSLSARLDGEPAMEEDPPALRAWLAAWRARHDRELESTAARVTLMNRTNPLFIARNHQVERALTLAAAGDMSAFDLLLEAVRAPFEPRADLMRLAAPPLAHERVLQTFCGT